MRKRDADWKPSEEQKKLWPELSGNAVNGLGEEAPRQPTMVFWHSPHDAPIAHLPVQRFFYAQPQPPEVAEARKVRQQAIELPLSPIAPARVERTPQEWSAELKRRALKLGADAVGIARMRPEWVFQGHEVKQKWIVVLGIAMDYETFKGAPDPKAAAEIHVQYGRGIRTAKLLANSLREDGVDALGTGGPMSGDFTMIPPALAAGLGELGKHGSIINRKLGACFRLSCVLTDVELVADTPDNFGADDFCSLCRLCVDACPPDAIFNEKQRVRGETRWYVDFDKCVPYFVEHLGCGICIAECPWSRPGVAENLLVKMSARRAKP